MLDQGIQPDSNCASRGIGYRQALAALQHWRAHPGDLQPSQLVLTLDISTSSQGQVYQLPLAQQPHRLRTFRLCCCGVC